MSELRMIHLLNRRGVGAAPPPYSSCSNRQFLPCASHASAFGTGMPMGLPARILSPIGSTILQGAPMPHAIRPSPEERKQTAVTDEDAFFWMTPSFG